VRRPSREQETEGDAAYHHVDFHVILWKRSTWLAKPDFATAVPLPKSLG
jgi:hypothetical protein